MSKKVVQSMGDDNLPNTHERESTKLIYNIKKSADINKLGDIEWIL